MGIGEGEIGDEMNIYEVDFEGMYPVGNALIIAAKNRRQAMGMAQKTITHTKVRELKQVNITKPCVVVYLSGDY